MPHTTSNYPFEFRIFEWADALAKRLAGDHKRFCLLLDEGGSTLRLVFDDAKSPDGAAAAWVLYDPFDHPEYAYMQWQNVSAATFERFLGSPFLPQEFVPMGRDDRGSELGEGFPTSWSVMF